MEYADGICQCKMEYANVYLAAPVPGTPGRVLEELWKRRFRVAGAVPGRGQRAKRCSHIVRGSRQSGPVRTVCNLNRHMHVHRSCWCEPSLFL